MNKGYLTSNIFFGATFLIVTISIFAGAYHSNLSLGVIFIVWTVNGFLQGMIFERRRRNIYIEKVYKAAMEKIMETDILREKSEGKDGKL